MATADVFYTIVLALSDSNTTIKDKINHLRDILKFCQTDRHFNQRYCGKNGILWKTLWQRDSSKRSIPNNTKKMYETLFRKIEKFNIEEILVAAIELKLEILVEFAIKEGAKTEDKLYMAARNGDIEIAKILLENGANIHYGDDFALIEAIENINFPMVKFLIENKANIQADSGLPLETAAKVGNLEIIKYLVEKGADIRHNTTALKNAISNNHKEVVQFLIGQGSNVTDKVMIEAPLGANLELFQYLQQQGGNIHADNEKPFMIAIGAHNIPIINYLLVNGTNIHIKSGVALAYAAGSNYLNLVQFFLDQGLNFNQKNKDRGLQIAATFNDFKAVDYLLEKGANINYNNGLILEKMLIMNLIEMAKYLIEKGADINLVEDKNLLNLLNLLNE